jgi:hypothetical protein
VRPRWLKLMPFSARGAVTPSCIMSSRHPRTRHIYGLSLTSCPCCPLPPQLVSHGYKVCATARDPDGASELQEFAKQSQNKVLIYKWVNRHGRRNMPFVMAP